MVPPRLLPSPLGHAPRPDLAWRRPSAPHLIGIGGTGMSPLALLLLEVGCRVSGSDAHERPALDMLRRAGAAIHIGHDPSGLHGVDRVVASPAIPALNPELAFARRHGVPIESRAAALAGLIANRESLCITGSHGKTTTAAMLAFVCTRAGFDPGYMIGGTAAALDRPARLGTGPFVLEACEAFGALDAWHPAHLLVTNLDDEHPEHYGGVEGLRQAFVRLASRVRPTGAIVLCGDAIEPAALGLDPDRAVTYGLNASNTLCGELVAVTDGGSRFNVRSHGQLVASVALTIPGIHNVRNTLGVIALASALGIPVQATAECLVDFTGVDRRCQVAGEADGVRVFDDYAHHPTEIAAALSVGRLLVPAGRRLFAVTGPQLHSRVARLADQFAEALSRAAAVVVLPVESAGETTTLDGNLALACALERRGVTFVHAESAALAAAHLLERVRPGDVVATLGPGEVAAVPPLLLAGLQARASAAASALSIGFGAQPAVAALPLVARVRAHAREIPSAPASICGRDSLTYAELIDRADALAARLTDFGVGQEDVVAVRLPPSNDRVVAFLGAISCGSVYLPIDESVPPDRLTFILNDAKVVAMVGYTGARTLDIVARTRAAKTAPAAPDPTHCAAYAIYTSGTTGTPKAVVVEHGALANFARAAAQRFGIDRQSRVSQVSGFGFDVSVGDMASALHAGACLVFPADDSARTGASLGRFIDAAKITHLSLTPSALATLPDRDYVSLSSIVVAGEACPKDLVNRHGRRCRFFNAYGPTEATVFATVDECRPDEDVTIGVPLDNVTACVLDAERRPVARGTAGELWLAGAGLARGYLGRQDLTAEMFRSIDLDDHKTRAYRTGDIARMRPDGRLSFLGRADDQVKLRGIRIELGEIEAALRRLDAVIDAVAAIRQDPSGTDRLVAYVQCAEGVSAPSLAEISSSLSSWLPRSMCPSAIVQIDRVPVSANGKRDRRALPAPSWRKRREPLKVPSGATEFHLLELLRQQQGLNTGDVGIRDPLNEVVDSLAMAAFFTAVETEFRVEMSPAAIGASTTIELLALHLDRVRHIDHRPAIDRPLAESVRRELLKYVAAWRGVRRSHESLIVGEVSSVPARQIFWCCQGDEEYRALAERLQPVHGVYGMRSGHLVFSYTPDNVAALAALYAEEMIALQPDGGFLLGGNCQGGTIARAVAVQLQARGRTVDLLWLMEQGRFPIYDGRVILIFGADSHSNPYGRVQAPERIFELAYGGNFAVRIIPGAHGQYFQSPGIDALAHVVKSTLATLEDPTR